MSITVTDARISDKGRIELQINAPATDVAALLDECEEELARAGGIVPDGKRSTLESRYGAERLKALTEEWLMDRIGTQTFGASDKPLVGFPQYVLVDDGYPEGPFVFQAVCYELPKGEISSVEPLELGPLACVVSEAELDRTMKSFVKAYGARRVTDEVRPAKYGDVVKVDMEISAGGVPVVAFSKKDSSLTLDYATMPSEFIDQVVGMSPGDVKEFSYTLPGIEGICADERFDAKVTLVALYFVDEPKLTPKWVQGKFPGLKNEQDLRNAMAQNLAQRAGGLPNKEDAIDQALFERLSIEVPDEIVDFVTEGVRRAEAQRMHGQGMSFDMYCQANDVDPDTYLGNLRATVERDIKLSAALDAVYAAKGFELKESDIDMLFDQMAPGQSAEMKHGYIMSGRLYLAEEMAQRAKARRWLHETATLAAQ